MKSSRSETRLGAVNNRSIDMGNTMLIYSMVVDPTITAAEGLDWWREVQLEMQAVLDAPTTVAAASLISWWMTEYEWRLRGDSPVRVAQRIRNKAKALFSARRNRA